MELSLVLDTRHRPGARGNQTARPAVHDVDLLGLLGLSRLRSGADFCSGIDIEPSGKAGSSPRWFRQHDMVYDTWRAGFGRSDHRLGTLLPTVTSVGSVFSLELLLADCSSRFYGDRRDGAYSPAECSHCDYQPDACQSLRKPRLQESVQGINWPFCCQLPWPGATWVSISHRVHNKPNSLGTSSRRRA